MKIPTVKHRTIGASKRKHAKSPPTLCDPMDSDLPGSSVCGILQAGILERVAISSSRRSSRPRDPTGNRSCVYCFGKRVL